MKVKFSSEFIEMVLFSSGHYLVIIGIKWIFKWHHQQSLIFCKISARDNRLKCKFSSHINKTALFLGKCFLAIIRVVRIFDWIHKICHIFEKISACDNKDNSKCQIASTKLLFWGGVGGVYLVITAIVWIFKWLCQNCLTFCKTFSTW